MSQTPDIAPPAAGGSYLHDEESGTLIPNLAGSPPVSDPVDNEAVPPATTSRKERRP
jgi:hypothetical protein